MKCEKCGHENKSTAKFCTKCGNSFNKTKSVSVNQNSGNSSKYIIVALIAIIIILVGTIGFFVLNNDSGSAEVADISNTKNASQSVEADKNDDAAETQVVKTSQSSSSSSKTSQVEESKSWHSIGSYSGSGSGSQTINVPPGKIMVKLSAYPIKNYATNHLYVSGTNGQFGGVDWGSKSAVETRSDSFTYTSTTDETMEIDYYETSSWQVEFFIYE